MWKSLLVLALLIGPPTVVHSETLSERQAWVQSDRKLKEVIISSFMAGYTFACDSMSASIYVAYNKSGENKNDAKLMSDFMFSTCKEAINAENANVKDIVDVIDNIYRDPKNSRLNLRLAVVAALETINGDNTSRVLKIRPK